VLEWALYAHDQVTAAQLQLNRSRGGGSSLIRAACGRLGHGRTEQVQGHGSEPGLHRLRDLATRHPKRRSVCSAGLPDPAVDHVGVQPMGQSNTAHARSGLAALGQHLGLEVFAVLTAARSPFV